MLTLLREEAEKRPALVHTMLKRAEQGDFRFMELTWAYLYGKPVQAQVQLNLSPEWSSAVGLLDGALAAAGLLAPVSGTAPTLVVEGAAADDTHTPAPPTVPTDPQ